jgi:Serine hydrolase (FSH1)
MSFSGTPDLITLPTLHLHGTKDVNYANGKKQLAEFYDQKSSRLLEIDYHHAMPWFKADLMKLVRGIESIHEGTRDE